LKSKRKDNPYNEKTHTLHLPKKFDLDLTPKFINKYKQAMIIDKYLKNISHHSPGPTMPCLVK
tara:strand:- start:273 stop:461 length:189 start_codon:yes stop_codon:yes gene_type:complete